MALGRPHRGPRRRGRRHGRCSGAGSGTAASPRPRGPRSTWPRVDAAALPDGRRRSPGRAGPAVAEAQAGELVRATGTWRADRTLLVADQRRSTATQGRWVVTGLEVDGPDGDRAGPRRAGLAARRAAAAPAPAGPGAAGGRGHRRRLAPAVRPARPARRDRPARRRRPPAGHRGPGQPLARGPRARASSSPPPPPSRRRATDLALLPGPPAEDTAARDWRNLAYSAQWFVFAAFAVVLWWRMLRDDAARSDPSRPDLPRTRPRTCPTTCPQPAAPPERSTT